MIRVTCAQCRRSHLKQAGHVNRTRKLGGKFYCSLRCSGLARRKPKLPEAERRAKKATYDAIRRAQMADEIKAEKREYYRRTFDAKKAKAVREARKLRLGADYHTKYMRKYFADPKRKLAKRLYDRRRRDRRTLGPYASAAIVLRKLEALIRKREPSHYERRKSRGYYDTDRTTQQRKRDAQISRW